MTLLAQSSVLYIALIFTSLSINKNVDISLIFFTADKPRNFNLISSREVTNEVLNNTGGEQMFW